MNRIVSSIGMMAAVLCAGAVAVAGQSAKVDVTGAWTFTVESAAGTSMPSVTFKQEGEKLTGRYSSALVGEAELAGTVKDQTITFTVAGNVQGTKIELKYAGTMEGKDSMTGKLSTGDFGGGTFTAKRNK